MRRIRKLVKNILGSLSYMLTPKACSEFAAEILMTIA